MNELIKLANSKWDEGKGDKMLENKMLWKHDFDGECVPTGASAWRTFSVGVFQWVPTAGGQGLKRSPVKYRIRGDASNPEPTFARAREVCRMMDDGWVPRKKAEAVK